MPFPSLFVCLKLCFVSIPTNKQSVHRAKVEHISSRATNGLSAACRREAHGNGGALSTQLTAVRYGSDNRDLMVVARKANY